MKYDDFASLGIDQRILDAVRDMGFDAPTPVQEQTIPLALSGGDLLVQAPTGTGKTAAFAIPILNAIDTSKKSVQAVVLCPTRELVMQITDEFRKIGFKLPNLSVLSIYGGQNIERQLAGIRRKPHVIVGTTGRVMDHLNRRTLKLDDAKTVVLDEADEMLDMGFRGDIDFILAKMNSSVQVMLFSATVPREILDVSKQYQHTPTTVKTTCDGMDLPKIKQYVCYVKEDNKYELLRRIMREENYRNVLVFVNTKLKAAALDKRLNADFCLSSALHGDMRQKERDKVMRAFRAHEINMLIATDVAARGIDVDGIEAIFNYDVPLDEEYYIHRIGRTARASRSGTAYTFASTRDKSRLIACEKVAAAKMYVMELEGLTSETPKRTGKDYGVATTRFFVNIGTRDGATKQNVTDWLQKSADLKPEEIFDVNLRDNYGFIEIPTDKSKRLTSLKGQRVFRRVLSVEQSLEKGEAKPAKHEQPRDKTDFSAARPENKDGKRAAVSRKPRTKYDKPETGEARPKFSTGKYSPRDGRFETKSSDAAPTARKEYESKKQARSEAPIKSEKFKNKAAKPVDFNGMNPPKRKNPNISNGESAQKRNKQN